MGDCKIKEVSIYISLNSESSIITLISGCQGASSYGEAILLLHLSEPDEQPDGVEMPARLLCTLHRNAH